MTPTMERHHRSSVSCFIYQRQKTSKMSRSSSRAGHSTANKSAMPLKQPSRHQGANETLLQKSQDRRTNVKSKADEASTTRPDTSAMPSHTSALITTLLYSPTLTLIHFTFHILVLHQYSQLGSSVSSSIWTYLVHIIREYLLVYAVLVYVMHIPLLAFRHYSRIRECIFALGGIAAGCLLVRMTHRAPYLEMVKRAPVTATLWMWCVLEMSIGSTMAMAAAVGAFAWRSGYGFT